MEASPQPTQEQERHLRLVVNDDLAAAPEHIPAQRSGPSTELTFSDAPLAETPSRETAPRSGSVDLPFSSAEKNDSEPQDETTPMNYSPLKDTQIAGFSGKVYKNGAYHAYAIDAETGKKKHISLSDVQKYYGVENDEQGPRPVATETANANTDIVNDAAAEIDYDDPEAVERAILAAADQAELQANQVDFGADEASREAAPALEASPDVEQTKVEPLNDPSEAGIKSRLKRIWSNAKAELGQFMAMRPADYVRSKTEHLDQSEKRRVKIIAAAAGAVLVAGLATVAYKQGNLDFLPGIGDGAEGAVGDVSAVPAETAPSPAVEAAPPLEPAIPSGLEVPQGKGFEDALQQQYGLTDAQAHEAFSQMKDQIAGSPGTYTEGTDVRISQSGVFELNPAARAELEEYLRSIGKAA